MSRAGMMYGQGSVGYVGRITGANALTTLTAGGEAGVSGPTARYNLINESVQGIAQPNTREMP